MTIKGAGFVTGLTLEFTGQASAPAGIQVVNSTTIAAVMPPSTFADFTYSAGLLLTNPGGLNVFQPDVFTYVGSTTPAPTPPATPPTSSSNREPAFPGTVNHTPTTSSQYGSVGRLMGAVTTVTVTTPATDQDGDTITYSWESPTGGVQSNGLTATWTRIILQGQVSRGSLTVTASDGKGGTAAFTFNF